MNDKDTQVIVDGDFMAGGEPAVSVSSRGLMYGDGCFETVCAFHGQYFMLSDHLTRLREGVDYLGITYPQDLDPGNIRSLLAELLQRNNLMKDDAIIRLQVWREGDRGYFTRSNESNYSVCATPKMALKSSYHLKTVKIRRIPSASLPSRFKFTNGINYIAAAEQARKKGGDDALMLTVAGHVAETTVANLFWMRGDVIFTPSTGCDILPGITRQAVLKLLEKESGVSVRKGKFKLEELKNATSAWLCNSVKQIALISQIDDCTFETEAPFLAEFQKTYRQFRQDKLAKKL